LDVEIQVNLLPVEGEVPQWLSGTLLRNGPAKFTHKNNWVSNWFDGLAMVHAFTCQNGTVSYANKFLRTTDYAAVRTTGSMSYGGFLQDPCSHLFKNLFSLFVPHEQHNSELHNANINIVKLSDHFVALTETPLPVEFDAHTLATLGVLPYADSLPQADIHDTAHPHYDPVAQEHIAFMTTFGLTSFHKVYRMKHGSAAREIIAQVPVQEPSYMHSFSITERYAILAALPLVSPALPLGLVLRQRAFIHNFTWKPEQGTTFIILDRINNKLVAQIKGEPFFAFHTVNAFEHDTKISMDIVVYRDNSVINDAHFDLLLHPQSSSRASGMLTRFTLDLAAHTVSSEQLFDKPLELPRINYEANSRHDYRYVYAYGYDHCAYVPTKLYKIDIKTGTSLTWQEPGCYPGEPVFVATPGCTADDGGIVMSIVLDVNKKRSFLLLLDATTFKQKARVYVPHHIPFGIHGAYYSKH
jgi:carotenoid cleavage dioxygenase-like enzyme